MTVQFETRSGSRVVVSSANSPTQPLKGGITELNYLIKKAAERRVPGGYLPRGWTEAVPGGMATNAAPKIGGIIDQNLVTGDWFVIFNNGSPVLEGFKTRDAAVDAFETTLGIARRA